MSGVITYEYLPKQQVFFQNCDEVPFSAYIGGFGSGKTHGLVLQVLRACTRMAPSFGLVGAPTYRMLSDTTQRKFFELCPPAWIERFIKSENRVVLKNKTEIIFRSLESPERLTNLELSWFAIDEIGEVILDTFRMLQGRLRDPRGCLKGFCVGNPAGPAHWTCMYFLIKKEPSYRLVQASSYENTFLPQQYFDEMETSFGKDSVYYKRFVLGLFVAPAGAIWPNFSPRPYPDGHVVSDEQVRALRPIRFGRVIDFGIEHPFVCMWWAISASGREIIFLDEYAESHKTIRYHCLRIKEKEKELRERFGPFDIDLSVTDHDAVARTEIVNCTDENGDYIGFDVTPADKAVLEGILLVSSLFEQKRCLLSDRCELALRQVVSYHTKSKDNVATPIAAKEQPVKRDDDTCDCIRMACKTVMPETLGFLRSSGRYLSSSDIYDGKIE